MEYVLFSSATTQSVAAVTNSIAVLYKVPEVCRTMEYRIIENHPWIFVNSFWDGPVIMCNISVETTSIDHVGEYEVTFEAKLTNYADVTPLEATFLVKIINPCVNTTLNLSTALQPVTITSLSGVSNTQSFSPATDSVSSTAFKPGLCGNIIFSIVEVQY